MTGTMCVELQELIKLDFYISDFSIYHTLLRKLPHCQKWGIEKKDKNCSKGQHLKVLTDFEAL